MIKETKFKSSKEFTPEKAIKLGVALGTIVIAVTTVKKLSE